MSKVWMDGGHIFRYQVCVLYLQLTDLLSSSADDFSSGEEVFEAVGELLMQGDENKSEQQVR